MSITRRLFLRSGAAGSVMAVLGGRALAQLSSPKPSATVLIETFSANGKSLGATQVAHVVKSDAQWRAQLSRLAFEVTRHADTEAPFSGAYEKNHATGLYNCICCDTALFDSHTKFEPGTGWPSFWR